MEEGVQSATRGRSDEARLQILLPRLALLFLKIGCIGFGGGMATIALMEQEVVRRRRLLATEEFVHGVGLGQILGPFAVNTSFFVGYRLFGLTGALVCAGAFLAPSVSLVIGLSWLYFTYHRIPALQGAMAGLGPVVIALIVAASWSMGRKALRAWPAWTVAALALGGNLLKLNPVYLLVTAGAVGLLLGKERLTGGDDARRKPRETPRLHTPKDTRSVTLLAIGGPLMAAGSLGNMATAFAKIGMVFFGGGFVLIPVLHARLVETLRWLTPQEFIDGVAISNLTPGPIAVLATFTGFRLHGVPGALVATLALFAPATILMLGLSWQYERLKGTKRAQDFLAGVTPAVVGLVLGAAVILAPSSLPSLGTAALAFVALALLVRFRWHPAFVLTVGAILGALRWIP